MAPAQGFYINLDRSPQRRRAVEAEIARAGLAGRYRRFPGIDGAMLPAGRYAVTPGEAGCFLSHLGAIEAGAASGRPVHVLEDDALLCRGFARHLAMIVDRVLDHFDIVFTDMLLPGNPEFTRDCLAYYRDHRSTGAFNVFAGTYWACMASYVVHPGAAGKLAGLLRQEEQAGMRQPVDLYLARLVKDGSITAGCLFPFVTSVHFPYPGMARDKDVARTTIHRPRETVAERLIVDLPRAAFYIDIDLKRLRSGLAALAPVPEALRADFRNCAALLDAMPAR
jgi:GR25 family glycosyltransferase involved in LPS biosynthesis